MFTRLMRWLSKALEVTIVLCLALMAILVFGNVVLRYAFNSGIAISEELARLLFVWLIFLGAIVASRQHAHIGVDTLVQRLPAAGKKIVILLTGLLMLGACAMFVIGGWRQTLINLENRYPVLDMSYAWLYAVAIVFGVGMAISIVYNLYEAFTRKQDDDDLVLIQDLGARIEEKIRDVNTGARRGRSE